MKDDLIKDLMRGAGNLIENIGNEYLPSDHPFAGKLSGQENAIREMREILTVAEALINVR